MHLSFHLYVKYKYEEYGPGRPRAKGKTLFEKYLKQKGLGAHVVEPSLPSVP
jgi:hypothetical protein